MYKPPPLMLHARMLQKKRLGNLEKFARMFFIVFTLFVYFASKLSRRNKFLEEENSVLLATDVAARGLDIQQIEHVIHYQLPRTAELYIHRCGRTARATKEGLAILLIDPQDVYYYHRICRNLDRGYKLSIILQIIIQILMRSLVISFLKAFHVAEALFI
ncbi:unnamed protein product [Thelazia callipaeda]|uniref:Helicase C-terminal domain-containing protein n=1 Tax=Thelazia callipaeda TaxID=103827 RepID=A0A0N5DBT7_THECL|nr:unnamed protein product [Thelazia callipaeda]